MKDEVDAAVAFLVRVIARNSSLDRVQLDALGERLRCVLTERFRDHWFPERPSRGQAYRCIRINETEPREPVLEQASRRCGLGFGERRGVYYVLASFKGGRKDNFVDQINIDELEQRSGDRPKQSLPEMVSGRKRGVGSGSARASPWGVAPPKGPTTFSPPQFLSRGGTLWNLSAGLPPSTTPGQKPDKYHWVNKALVKA
ncbi:maternal B9.15 protein-like isoform X2 [Dermacentor andersoni]|uniref:maternal B9.15 protein-like isoform X2 n=1 Tax=Dermacentor andersoni TaxID=34620 RepID=UPI0024167EAF|nr:protein BTG4-like isoform X2 [Dermacentor andersoni]